MANLLETECPNGNPKPTYHKVPTWQFSLNIEARALCSPPALPHCELCSLPTYLLSNPTTGITFATHSTGYRLCRTLTLHVSHLPYPRQGREEALPLGCWAEGRVM